MTNKSGAFTDNAAEYIYDYAQELADTLKSFESFLDHSGGSDAPVIKLQYHYRHFNENPRLCWSATVPWSRQYWHGTAYGRTAGEAIINLRKEYVGHLARKATHPDTFNGFDNHQ